jgi:hypothetical protein
MKQKSKLLVGMLVLVLALATVIQVALAAIWAPVESGVPDNINNEYDWSGSITTEGAEENYVCLHFEGDVIPPVLCDLNPAGPLGTGVTSDYTCSLPYTEINDIGSPVNWEIVHTPNDVCTGYGTQPPAGDSGTISPTAVEVTSFGAQAVSLWSSLLNSGQQLLGR